MSFRQAVQMYRSETPDIRIAQLSEDISSLKSIMKGLVSELDSISERVSIIEYTSPGEEKLKREDELLKMEEKREKEEKEEKREKEEKANKKNKLYKILSITSIIGLGFILKRVWKM